LHARLADFGLLTIISDSTTLSSYTQGGTTRWMSPELFDPEVQEHHQTKYSDCYALGMVIYEVLSRHIPFYQYPNMAIYGKVVRGDRPERPQGVERVWFTDDVWEVLEHCWVPQPRSRPSIKSLLQHLEKASKCWTPPSQLLTGGASSVVPAVSMDGSGKTLLSQKSSYQPSEKLHLAESTGTIKRVGR